MIPIKIFYILDTSSRIAIMLLLVCALITGLLEVFFIHNSILLFSEIGSKQIQYQSLLYLGSLFFILTLMRLLMVFFKSVGIHYVGFRLSKQIIESFFQQDFLNLRDSDFSELTSTLMNKINQTIRGIFLPIVSIVILCTMGVLSIVLYTPKLEISYLVMLGVVSSFYVILILSVRQNLNGLSNDLNLIQTRIVGEISSVKPGIRELIIGSFQDSLVKLLGLQQKKYRKALAFIQIYGEMPRYLLELSAIILFGIWLFLQKGNIGLSTMSTILASALTASRVIPAMQQAFAGWSTYRTNVQSAMQVITDLKDLKFKQQQLTVKAERQNHDFQEIKLVGIGYGHDPKNRKTLNLTIKRGEKLAIEGTSGAGKTTFLDILSGLRKSSEGVFFIDGVEIDPYYSSKWKEMISYSGQSTFTLPSYDLKENIILSRFSGKMLTEKDYKQCISDVCLIKHHNDTESVINFSGGELQRIALARVFIQDKNLILLDEPTSALDQATSTKLMKRLLEKFHDSTIICVSHDNNVTKFFDRVIKL